MKLYEVIASTLTARQNCIKSGNAEWLEKHTATLRDLESFLPSGSGVDSGSRISEDESTGDKIVIDLGYHHMNDGGMYDGWTEHRVTVRPSLAFGIVLSIGGRNRNDIKECLHEITSNALSQEMTVDQESRRYVPVQS